MMLDSGTVSLRASSRSTGNLPTPHSFTSAARSAGLPRSTRFGVNGMSFSYSAISCFQQNDASGGKCRVSDMEKLPVEQDRPHSSAATFEPKIFFRLWLVTQEHD